MGPIIGKTYRLNNSLLIHEPYRGREFIVESIEDGIIMIRFTHNNYEAHMSISRWEENVELQLSNIGNSKLEFKFV